MKALLEAEWYKIVRQSKTYYALGALFVIEGIVLISAYFQGTTIIELLLDNLKQAFYFEGTLVNGNLLVYLLLNTLWFHLPLILMILVSGFVTSEYKDRTLQAMLLHPVAKWKILFSKYVLGFIVTTITVMLLAVSAFVISYMVFGTGDLIVYLDALNFYTHLEAKQRLIGAFFVGWVSMLFFSTASITIAVVFKEATKTWIVCALFLILSNLLLKVDFGLEWVNTLFFVKLNDTWQYLFYNTIPWEQIMINIGLLIFYIALFISAGLYLFQKKDIG